MISTEKYKELMNNGLMLDHYLVLSFIKAEKTLPDLKRIQGFKNLLVLKGFLTEDSIITEKGNKLLKTIEPEPVVVVATTTTTTMSPDYVERKFVIPQNSIAAFAEKLHEKCQNKILELTGKKQVRPEIDKKTYSFLPNSYDFGKVLTKAILMYKIKDYTKVEKAILRYIEKCHSENNWFPLMQYFILKNNTSPMVTFMDEEHDDFSKEKGSNQNFV